MRNLLPLAFVFPVWGCGVDGDSTLLFGSASGPPGPAAMGQLPSLEVDAGLVGDAGEDAAIVGPADAGQSPPWESTLPVGIVGLPPRLSATGAMPFAEAPQWLSETGVFANLELLVPSSSLVPYQVQAPLFSDGAVKSRWLALPEGQMIGFRATEPWEFPVGTVFIKQFDMALDKREPLVTTRLETRLLVVGAEGEFYGVTYRWNQDATDAEVVLRAETLDLQVIDEFGQAAQQPYLLPGPRDCMTCHDSRVGWALGVRTLQLHHAQTEAQAPMDQLLQWSDRGVFDQELSTQEVLALPSLASLDDETRSVEDRVRSYLDSNCSHCHGLRDDVFVNFDARFTTALPEQKLVWAPAVNPRRGVGSKLLVPGNLEESELYVRDASTESGTKMPPLGRDTADDAYLALLSQWILSLQGDARFPAP